MNECEMSCPLVILVFLSTSLQLATMSAMAVLISAGTVLGKTNLVQLMVMALVEVTAFGTMRWINKQFLMVSHGAVRGPWKRARR
jgi:Rhesus blood group glycoprotein